MNTEKTKMGDETKSTIPKNVKKMMSRLRSLIKKIKTDNEVNNGETKKKLSFRDSIKNIKISDLLVKNKTDKNEISPFIQSLKNILEYNQEVAIFLKNLEECEQNNQVDCNKNEKEGSLSAASDYDEEFNLEDEEDDEYLDCEEYFNILENYNENEETFISVISNEDEEFKTSSIKLQGNLRTINISFY